jgi:hypothetical protein
LGNFIGILIWLATLSISLGEPGFVLRICSLARWLPPFGLYPLEKYITAASSSSLSTSLARLTTGTFFFNLNVLFWSWVDPHVFLGDQDKVRRK